MAPGWDRLGSTTSARVTAAALVMASPVVPRRDVLRGSVGAVGGLRGGAHRLCAKFARLLLLVALMLIPTGALTVHHPRESVSSTADPDRVRLSCARSPIARVNLKNAAKHLIFHDIYCVSTHKWARARPGEGGSCVRVSCEVFSTPPPHLPMPVLPLRQLPTTPSSSALDSSRSGLRGAGGAVDLSL